MILFKKFDNPKNHKYQYVPNNDFIYAFFYWLVDESFELKLKEIKIIPFKNIQDNL